MTIKEIVKYGIEQLKENNIDEPYLKMRMLTAYFLNKNKEYLISHDTEKLLENEEKNIKEGIKRLMDHEPIQYILGYQEFMGLKFKVNKNVLIPRPDTEILVEEVLQYIKESKTQKVLDMCTGSGAIAIAIKKFSTNNVEIDAADISDKAIEVANNNSKENRVNVNFIKSDLFKNIKQKYDIIVANPPYIETEIIKTLSEEVKNEPMLALDGGKDGLDVYRRIILEGYNFLNDNGYIFLEIGYNQKDSIEKLIKNSGLYKNFYSKKDLGGNDRIVVFQKR